MLRRRGRPTFTSWAGIACLLAALVLAPLIAAFKHGPGALAIEADHLAYHLEQGNSHDSPAAHHDSADHEHVMAAILPSPGLQAYTLPVLHQSLHQVRADGTARDGPRRPPRLV
jgi:hypothetical protein